MQKPYSKHYTVDCGGNRHGREDTEGNNRGFRVLTTRWFGGDLS